MSLPTLPMELRLEFFLSLDFLSRVKLSSTNKHFQALHAAETRNTQQALLAYEIENSGRLIEQERMPCYGCFKVLPEASFYQMLSYSEYCVNPYEEYRDSELTIERRCKPCDMQEGKHFASRVLEDDRVILRNF